MQTLPSSTKISNLNGAQKVVAVAMMIGAVLGGVYLFNNYLAPFFIDFFRNIWKLIFLGGPLAILALYIITNPLVVWGLFATLSAKFTGFLIKLDPLSVMDRYLDHIKAKYNNLLGIITFVAGKKASLDREIAKFQGQVDENKRLGGAALKMNKRQEASMYGSMVTADTNSITNLMPMKQRLDKNLDFLQRVEENWKFGIKKLGYEIDGKRREFEIMEATYKGLRSAEDFINSDSEAAQLYGRSVKALEDKVTGFIGYADEFERRSKDVMSAIDIEKQANMDEGLKALEDYINGGQIDLTATVESVPFEDVNIPANIPQGEKKYRFLNNGGK